MALISMRSLTNGSGAEDFDPATSPRDRLFAEDFTTIKRALQDGVLGIKTADLQVVNSLTVGGASTLRGSLSVSGAASMSGISAVGAATMSSTLTVTGDSTFQGNLQVDGDCTVNGTLSFGEGGTGFAGNDHQHNGSDGTSNIPLTSIQGVTAGKTWATHNHSGDGSAAIPLSAIQGASGAWSAHNHDGTDGAPQIASSGIAAGAVTFAKVASGSIYTGSGTGDNQLAEGDTIADTRTRIEELFSLQGSHLFIRPGQMGRASTTENEAELEFFGEGIGTGTENTAVQVRTFDAGTVESCAGSILLPGRGDQSPAWYDTVTLKVYWATPQAYSSTTAKIDVVVSATDMFGGTITSTTETYSFDASTETVDAVQAETVTLSTLTLEPGILIGVVVRRQATDGGDDWGDEWLLLGVEVSLSSFNW